MPCFTASTRSLRSKGFGKYSNASISLARTAVSSVFCADMMITGMSGALAIATFSVSRPSLSFRTTSVSIRSKLPLASAASRPPTVSQMWVSIFSAASAALTTTPMLLSSSTIRTLGLLMPFLPYPRPEETSEIAFGPLPHRVRTRCGCSSVTPACGR